MGHGRVELLLPLGRFIDRRPIVQPSGTALQFNIWLRGAAPLRSMTPPQIALLTIVISFVAVFRTCSKRADDIGACAGFLNRRKQVGVPSWLLNAPLPLTMGGAFVFGRRYGD